MESTSQGRQRGLTVVGVLMILFGGAEVMTGFTHKYTRRAWLRDPETLTTASKSESTATAPGSRRREGSSSPRLNRFGIAIDLLILRPTVRRPYAADAWAEAQFEPGPADASFRRSRCRLNGRAPSPRDLRSNDCRCHSFPLLGQFADARERRNRLRRWLTR